MFEEEGKQRTSHGVHVRADYRIVEPYLLSQARSQRQVLSRLNGGVLYGRIRQELDISEENARTLGTSKMSSKVIAVLKSDMTLTAFTKRVGDDNPETRDNSREKHSGGADLQHAVAGNFRGLSAKY